MTTDPRRQQLADAITEAREQSDASASQYYRMWWGNWSGYTTSQQTEMVQEYNHWRDRYAHLTGLAGAVDALIAVGCQKKDDGWLGHTCIEVDADIREKYDGVLAEDHWCSPCRELASTWEKIEKALEVR